MPQSEALVASALVVNARRRETETSRLNGIVSALGGINIGSGYSQGNDNDENQFPGPLE